MFLISRQTFHYNCIFRPKQVTSLLLPSPQHDVLKKPSHLRKTVTVVANYKQQQCQI